MKIKGGKAGSVDRLKKDMERSSGDRQFIRNVKEGEDMRVRFITEPDEWFSYREHYSEDVYFFPCIGDNCPGCESDNEKTQRSSKRYLASALDVDEGRVVPLKLPLDLANRLIARYERYGNTITDRDYTLHRMGSGLNTTYDTTPEPPEKVNLSKYKSFDPEEILIQQFEDAWDTEVERDGDPGARDVPSRDVNQDKDDDDGRDEIPSEPSSSTGEDDDDGSYLTEEQALAMDKEDLLALAEQLGVKVRRNAAKEKIVEALFADAE